jgi:hypothetical protein
MGIEPIIEPYRVFLLAHLNVGERWRENFKISKSNQQNHQL